MSESPILNITEMEAAQSQPELIVNQAIRILEAVGQLSVIDSLADPPSSPADGDRYLVIGTATGDWVGHEDEIALAVGGDWVFLSPHNGWLAFHEADDGHLIFRGNTGGIWEPWP